MAWKCPPLHLPNWNNFWKWKEQMNANESFDRTASHMAGEYVSYNKPVAWGMLDKDGGIYDSICPEEHDREEGAYTIPLYTHPAELTDEEIIEVHIKTPFIDGYLNKNLIEFARAILRKAQEK